MQTLNVIEINEENAVWLLKQLIYVHAKVSKLEWNNKFVQEWIKLQYWSILFSDLDSENLSSPVHRYHGCFKVKLKLLHWSYLKGLWKTKGGENKDSPNFHFILQFLILHHKIPMNLGSSLCVRGTVVKQVSGTSSIHTKAIVGAEAQLIRSRNQNYLCSVEGYGGGGDSVEFYSPQEVFPQSSFQQGKTHNSENQLCFSLFWKGCISWRSWKMLAEFNIKTTSHKYCLSVFVCLCYIYNGRRNNFSPAA